MILDCFFLATSDTNFVQLLISVSHRIPKTMTVMMIIISVENRALQICPLSLLISSAETL